MNIGKNIKDLRVKSGLTQKDLAEKLNVTPQAVSRWELDSVEPSIDTMKEMAVLFNVSLDELLGNSGEQLEKAVNENNEEQNKTESKEELPIVSVCKFCGKPIRAGQGKMISSGGRFRKETFHVCDDCVTKATAAKEAKRLETHKYYRNLAFIVGGVVSGVVLAIIIAIGCMIAQGDMAKIFISIGIGFAVAIPIFTFLFCVLMRNTFVGDLWLEIASWGCVRFPGIIFSLDFDGIVFLIATKILFAILGFVFVAAMMSVATALGLLLSLFAFPFSIVWAFKRPDKTEMLDVDLSNIEEYLK